MKDKDVSVSKCNHNSLDGEDCENEVIKGGAIYCEDHFEIHYSEKYNSRLDSGSGLATSRVLQ